MVVGGYGSSGMEVCRALLSDAAPAVTVIVAGRSCEKARLCRRKLLAIFSDKEDHIRTACVNLEDLANGTEEFPQGVRVLVNVARKLPSRELTAQLVKRCVANSCAFIDQLHPDDFELDFIVGEIGHSEVPVILAAGMIPGMMAPLVKHACEQMDTIQRVEVDVIGTFEPQLARELVDMICEDRMSMSTFRDGKWQTNLPMLDSAAMRKHDFGVPYGLRQGGSFNLEEFKLVCEELHESRGLQNLQYAVYGTAQDIVIDLCMMLSMVFGKYGFPSLVSTVLSNRLRRSMERNPFRPAIVDVFARGTRDGTVTNRKLRVFDPEGSTPLTGKATAAFVKQILLSKIKGNTEPRYGGQALDFADAMKRLVAQKVTFEDLGE